MSNAIARVRSLAPLVLVVLLGTAAVLIAGCGGDDSGGTATAAGIEFRTPSASGATSPAATSPAATSPAASATAPVASATAQASASAPSAASAVVNITAKDTKFDKSTITVPAGVEITVNLTNDDTLIHNISFYPDKNATNAISEGELFKGPNVTKTEKFTSPAKAGTYYFHCDVHPTEMNGSFIVQ